MADQHDEFDSQLAMTRRDGIVSTPEDPTPKPVPLGAVPVDLRITTSGAEQINLGDVVDAAEAARLLSVGREHVVKLLQRGILPGKRLTATWVTTRQAVEAYRLSRRGRGRPRSRPD